jgi:serine/threonine protein kinase
LLALKTLKDRPQTGDEDFQKETVMLRSVMQLDHPHIIKLLATFHHKNAYNMVFPKASSNLRNYWIDHDSLQLSPKYILWVLKQLHGLASGVSKIHNFRVLPNKRSSAALAPVNPSSEDQLGRHHDLKPENVLWFEAISGLDDEKEGVLQIADFGLGKFHSQRSGSRTRTMAGTPAYEPPEARLKGEVSRPYDVWSLGCVFLEFLVWLLFNFKGLEDFGTERKATVETSFKDDAYFIVEGDRATLRHPVQEWIRKLRDDSRCQGPLASLLSLVENELLNVDPDTRIKADRLERRMGDILDRAKSDSNSLARILRPSAALESGPQRRLAPPSSGPESRRPQRGCAATTNDGGRRGVQRSSVEPDIKSPVKIIVNPPSNH